MPTTKLADPSIATMNMIVFPDLGFLTTPSASQTDQWSRPSHQVHYKQLTYLQVQAINWFQELVLILNIIALIINELEGCCASVKIMAASVPTDMKDREGTKEAKK